CAHPGVCRAGALRAGGNLCRAAGGGADGRVPYSVGAVEADQAGGGASGPWWCWRGDRARMSLSTVYLGLGSNIEREAHLCAGLDALAGILTDMRCSPAFESQAVGIKSGPFINFVVTGQTALPLIELDRRLK